MFQGCSSLQYVPAFTMPTISASIAINSMFQNCFGLESVPLFDTTYATNFTSMFQNCLSLPAVPLFNTVNASTFSNMFTNCAALKAVPSFNVSRISGSTMFNGMFSNCVNLKMAPLSGTKAPISYVNCSLARSEMVSIFNNLANTGSIACTIVVTGNHGVVDLTAADTASVIAKGWAITK
jgi:hypothetical protein